MKKLLTVAAIAAALTAAAVPAGAADQIVTASVDSVISMSTPPSATVSFGTLTTGAHTASGGSVGISANVPYLVTVSADKTAMSEYDTVGTAYVASGKTLASPLSIIPVRSGGTALVPGIATPAIIGVSTLLATATGLGTDTYDLTLSQPTGLTDRTLAVGHTYRIVLTYTASAPI